MSRRNLNIEGLNAMDLRTIKEDGTPWDLTQSADRKAACQKIAEDKPDWLIGSPPCTVFCQWNAYMNHPKNLDHDAVKKIIKKGRRHLRLKPSLYRLSPLCARAPGTGFVMERL